MSSDQSMVLSLSCGDQPGIVSAVAGLLYAAGCNILEAQQYSDPETGLFFMRVDFARLGDATFSNEPASRIAELADRLGMTYTLRPLSLPKRVMFLVSKFDHCLADLLNRWRIGELPMEPVAVVSNHGQEHLASTDLKDLPFFHLPVSRDNKAQQEAKLVQLIEHTDPDLIVLARYMQILSNGFAARLAGRCINIHHSFLPALRAPSPIIKRICEE